MEIRLLAVAQQELEEAIEYYNEGSPGLGDRFLLEALAAFERIKRFQKAWHPYTETLAGVGRIRFPTA
jgi:toxin ParE2